jgi:hypothetical protein
MDDIEEFNKKISNALEKCQKINISERNTIHRAFLIKKFVNDLLLGRGLDVSFGKETSFLDDIEYATTPYEVSENTPYEVSEKFFGNCNPIQFLEEDLLKMKEDNYHRFSLRGQSKSYLFASQFDNKFFSDENDPFNIINKKATKEQIEKIHKLILEIVKYYKLHI